MIPRRAMTVEYGHEQRLCAVRLIFTKKLPGCFRTSSCPALESKERAKLFFFSAKYIPCTGLPCSYLWFHCNRELWCLQSGAALGFWSLFYTFHIYSFYDMDILIWFTTKRKKRKLFGVTKFIFILILKR